MSCFEAWCRSSTNRSKCPLSFSINVFRDLSDSEAPLRAIFFATLHQIPEAVGYLPAASSTSTPAHHPKYIELLVDLAPHLNEDDASVVIDHYQRDCLCLPFTTDWINNTWKLMHAFHLSSPKLPNAKRRVSQLLFEEVYGYAEEVSEHRVELVDKMIIPFLEKTLPDEQDDDFVNAALAVLVNSAAADTGERDLLRRRARAISDLADLELDDARISPSQDELDGAAGVTFQAICSLIARIAVQTPCKAEAVYDRHAQGSGDLARSASTRNSSSSRGPLGLRGLMSPPPKDGGSGQPVSATANDPNIVEDPLPPVSPRTPSTSPAASHSDCKSLRATFSLISLFNRMAFSSETWLHLPRATRSPGTLRSIAIYRDLLALLYPMTDDQPSPQSQQMKMPAHCPKARIAILQFLTRLRADSNHRIYLRTDLDQHVSPYAAILKRTAAAASDARGENEDGKRRVGRTSLVDATDDRGPEPRSKEEPLRSRSRSRQPAVIRGDNPLWRIPETLDFEVPPNRQTSAVIMTYDSNHPSLKVKDSPPVEAMWLPVSEYVRALNGILRGHDWELVSYVFSFLPLQLSNKIFFHGRRATKEVRALLEVLCNGVMAVNGSWDKLFNIPSFIRKIDINAAAYQSLSILISYRGVFTRPECERLVQAFMAGLQGKSEIAKPCLQALTLSIFELSQHVGRHLTTIIDSMKNILSTTGLAVHILEFLIALGQNGSLFRNFTEDQYRLVFVVAINYIAEHNARSDQTVDLSVPALRESYTLSQHVIGLAYYAIYIWFMAVRLQQRQNLVPEITRELNKGRSQRVNLDEMAEVCFDWLARYTYGNADPRPAASFLSDMVMQEGSDKEPPKSQSWLLAGGIVTIQSHARSGWATITTTRPTGSTAIICKLENVPLLELGEANADLVSLPAFIMANRQALLDDEGPVRVVSPLTGLADPFRIPRLLHLSHRAYRHRTALTQAHSTAISGLEQHHRSDARMSLLSRATLLFSYCRRIPMLVRKHRVDD